MMNFLKRLFGLGVQCSQEPTDYVDSDSGFSLCIPASWRRTPLVEAFRATGGRIALDLPGQATLNISCGAPDPQMPSEKVARAETVGSLLARSVRGVIGVPLRDVATPISGEDNVARSEISTADGFHGLISILHRGRKYTLQYHATEQARDQLETLIRSFRLGVRAIDVLSLPKNQLETLMRSYRLANTTAPAEPELSGMGSAIAALDAGNEVDRQQARELLFSAGPPAIPALLSSVNACNQAISRAVMSRSGIGTRIEALQRRIEVLGEMRDIRAVPAILNAIGDSAKSQDKAPEAKKLLIASQDALVKLGHQAIQSVTDVLNTPSASIRLALVDVLARIGGSAAQQALRRMADDPATSVRELARRASDTFDFSIVSNSPTSERKIS